MLQTELFSSENQDVTWYFLGLKRRQGPLLTPASHDYLLASVICCLYQSPSALHPPARALVTGSSNTKGNSIHERCGLIELVSKPLTDAEAYRHRAGRPAGTPDALAFAEKPSDECYFLELLNTGTVISAMKRGSPFGNRPPRTTEVILPTWPPKALTK